MQFSFYSTPQLTGLSIDLLCTVTENLFNFFQRYQVTSDAVGFAWGIRASHLFMDCAGLGGHEEQSFRPDYKRWG